MLPAIPRLFLQLFVLIVVKFKLQWMTCNEISAEHCTKEDFQGFCCSAYNEGSAQYNLVQLEEIFVAIMLCLY